MGDENEKTISLILGKEEGAIPTSIKQLAMSFDRYLDEKEKLDRERHEEIIQAIAANQETTAANCKSCKLDVDEKFDSLEIVLFFVRNPKVLWFGAFVLVLTLYLAGVGGKDMVERFASLIK